ncbi:imidazolonepropionase [Humidisolicoccus flavus]|uniref:imidazolonepropionase n=1 Tax=Humidisolicoccus flavus TaxID=3111414 RepID=UPI003243E4E6
MQPKTGGSTLFTNIGELTSNIPDAPDVVHDAALVVEHGRIAWLGEHRDAPAADRRLDVEGRALLPGWVDSHTHLVFGGDRTAEFTARMSGEPYEAGGIHSTVRATRAASDAQLRSNLQRLVTEARSGGTTTIETKTGYGLSVQEELRAAQIARSAVDSITLLGAHVVPEGAEPGAYVELVAGPMMEGLAGAVDAVDVFCERGAFDEHQTRAILRAAQAHGLPIHVHANQLGEGPGVALGIEFAAHSVDHLNFLSRDDIAALAESWVGERGSVATVLPACDLSTRMPLAPARELLDAGARLAIASNCNPGSSYTTSMAFCVATAVLQMRLTVAEAIRAATLGGAIALGLDTARDDRPAVGHFELGASADLHLLEAPSATHLAYRPGVPLTAAVWKAGELVHSTSPRWGETR